MFGAGGIVVTFDLVNQTFQSVVVQPMCLPSGVGETSGTDQQSSVFDHGWAKCMLSSATRWVNGTRGVFRQWHVRRVLLVHVS